MGFDMDEDILQDFLVEAGEIIELLSEQLVELENNPDDSDLLNAIFRGFHTVKGGAGFLALNELVDVCHQAENLFDLLRNGQRKVSPILMDTILQALDSINDMFTQVQAREPLIPADAHIIETLRGFCADGYTEGAAPAAAAPAPVAAEPEMDGDLFIEIDAMDSAPPPPISTPSQAPAPSSGSGDIDDISEGEFEALLDELHGSGKGPTITDSPTSAPPPARPAADNDDITDDDFEALLDELHGKGSFSEDSPGGGAPVPGPAPTPAARVAPASSSTDEITDDEFESLLDDLHGSGQAPSAIGAEIPPPIPTPAPKPKPAAKPKAVAKPTPAAAPAAKAAPQQAVQTETTVRVDTKRLDQIMNMVGELVLVRNRLVSLGVSIESEDMTKAISNLDVVTADLQGAVMKTRMQPIKKVFGRFPRVVRDLARSLKKEITLELFGEDTDLDKNLVEALADPLVHLVRNSVDHGIEMPDDRERVNKPRTGKVKLSASQEGDHILLTIEDDGAGMDAEKLKQIAVERGVLDADAATRMADHDAYNLIFAPGFSTKVEISDISGRGVGMDVVKTKITQLNGTVFIDSQLGKGTVLEIKVPLTLAILPTLMVVVGEQTFALPLAGVSEIFHIDLTKSNIVDGQLTIIVREKAIPLFYLKHWLNKNGGDQAMQDEGHIVIVQIGNQQVGFVVDSLIGQEEVVIKPLDALLQGTPGMAGATITSDGGIALILDVPNLLKHYAHTSKNFLRS
ncbi:MAG: two-component system chemotaxis sensor kinase CheA [Phenylobacterium sp.]|jgi:two-component system chemotaxis sensor kinase CheA